MAGGKKKKMKLEDIGKFQLKRVNPFQGLVIDVDTWHDAHNYHREQLRFHHLVFHQVGIVNGLKVTANNPADLSVIIHPGVAIDPEGNIIIVPQVQRYTLKTQQKGMIYLVIQFREIPSGPYQPAQDGQPTRIIEGYRIQERDKLPGEPYLELARIDFNPDEKVIKEAKSGASAGKNEINLASRQEVTMAAPSAVSLPVAPERPAAVPVEAVPAQETVTVGHVVLGGASDDLQVNGWQNLAREIGILANLIVNVERNIPLDRKINQCTLLYLTGSSRFELSAEEQGVLGGFLKSGGVIFGEGSPEGQEGQSRGAREFGLAFNQLAGQLNCKLETVKRGHPLLSSCHVFSEGPAGAEAGMLLEGGHMVYSGSDYGNAWQGGHQANPLSREIIRSAFEMGSNIIAYARMIKAGH